MDNFESSASCEQREKDAASIPEVNKWIRVLLAYVNDANEFMWSSKMYRNREEYKEFIETRDDLLEASAELFKEMTSTPVDWDQVGGIRSYISDLKFELEHRLHNMVENFDEKFAKFLTKEAKL